jgi:hypothetical protein
MAIVNPFTFPCDNPELATLMVAVKALRPRAIREGHLWTCCGPMTLTS